jgi:hypothetical protein
MIVCALLDIDGRDIRAIDYDAMSVARHADDRRASKSSMLWGAPISRWAP